MKLKKPTGKVPAKISKHRKIQYPVDKIFVSRWSPRSFTGEKIPKKVLMTLFEAARWAPSAFNNQSWRFIYAFKGTKHWEKLYSLLGEWNKMWCDKVGVLMLLVSKKTYDYNGKPARTHSLDVGAAWENLALQASMLGLAAHGMAGFDYDSAAKSYKLDKGYQVEAMIAVGVPGPKSKLPNELKEKEVISGRKKISEFAFEGEFKQ